MAEESKSVLLFNVNTATVFAAKYGRTAGIYIICAGETPRPPLQKKYCRREGRGEVDRGGLAHGDAGLHAGL